MAYKQPRVPQLRESDAQEWMRETNLFLRDFCMASWDADRRKDEEMERMKKRLSALEEGRG